MTHPTAPEAVLPSRRAPSPLTELRRADGELRRIVLRVRQWGLEGGRTCSTDALTALVAAVVEEAREGRRSPLQWSSARVLDVLVVGAPGQCARLGIALPAGLSPALTLWLDYLHALGALSADSEPVERLRAAARLGGPATPPTLRRRLTPRHPAGTARR
jgi:hypothetical protein